MFNVPPMFRNEILLNLHLVSSCVNLAAGRGEGREGHGIPGPEKVNFGLRPSLPGFGFDVEWAIRLYRTYMTDFVLKSGKYRQGEAAGSAAGAPR